MILYIIVMGIFGFLCFQQCRILPKNTPTYPVLHQMGKIAYCSGILMLIAYVWRMLLHQTPKILLVGAVLIYSVGLIYTMLQLHTIHKNGKED